MLIYPKCDKGSLWAIDENTANHIPEIRDVLNNPNQGAKAVAVIAFVCDPLSELVESYGDDTNRIKKEAFRWVFKDKGTAEDFYKVKSIQAAMEAYRVISDTPISRMIKRQKESIIRTSEELAEMVKQIGDDSDLEKIVKALKEMPLLIKQYKEAISNQALDIQETKARVKGERVLTPAEEQYRKRK